jgi:hypothetical protein
MRATRSSTRDGRRLPDWPAPFPGDAVEPSAAAFAHLLAANELATSTVVVRAGAQRAAGPFATNVGRSSTDWEMWLRLALRGAVAYTAAPGARYRRHANSSPAGRRRAASACAATCGS